MKSWQTGYVGICAVVIGSVAAQRPAEAQSYSVMVVDSPRFGYTSARGLNHAGRIAGRSGTGFSTQTRSFVSMGGGLFSLLDTLPGGDYSSAFAINNLDQVVGSSNRATTIRAFLWSPTEGMRGLGTLPGDTASQAFSINNTSQVVGYSSGPAGERAFLWTALNGMRNLGTLPGGKSSRALDISDVGQVVGTSGSPSGTRAFIWSSSSGMTDLGVLPGHTSSQAVAINDAGLVVGFSSQALGDTAFTWTRASGMQALPMLGGDFSRALDVNNINQIVGAAITPQGYRAVIWTARGVRDLNDLIPASAQVMLSEAHAINDRGQILAYGTPSEDLGHDTHENPGRVFLLTPVGR